LLQKTVSSVKIDKICATVAEPQNKRDWYNFLSQGGKIQHIINVCTDITIAKGLIF
jgi:hypothetical protein